jgi:hypothetical protein
LRTPAGYLLLPHDRSFPIPKWQDK